MLTGCWQDWDGTGFLSCWCWSIDQLVRWDLTYCVGCESADTWGCACLCVALEWVVYNGDMIGCIVCSYGVNSVFLSICFSRVMVSLIGPYSRLLLGMCNMLIGVHCASCIWRVLGMFVLNCVLSVQYMTYGMYYM